MNKVKKYIALPLLSLIIIIFTITYIPKRKTTPFAKITDITQLNFDTICSMVQRVQNPQELSKADKATYYLLASQVTNDITQSDSLLNLAASYYSKKKDSLYLAYTYYQIGVNAENNKQNLLATAYYQRCANMYPRQDKFYAHCNMYLGFMYSAMDNYEASIFYFQRAYRLSLKLKNYKKICFILMFMAPNYLELPTPEPDSAIYYSKLAIKVMKQSHSLFLDSPYSTISQSYSKQGEYKKALEYSNRSIEATNGKTFIRELINRAEIFYHLHQYDSALTYLSKINENSLHIDRKNKLLSLIYQGKGEYKKALEVQKKHTTYLDSCYSDSKNSYLKNLRLLMKFNEVNEENWNHQVHEEMQEYKLIAVVTTLICLFIILLYIQYLRIKHHKIVQKKEIEQLNIEYKLELERQRRKEVELREQFLRKLNSFTINSNGVRHSFSDEEWNTMLDNVNVAFSGLINKLKEQFPMLNNEDIRYCCLTKMGFSQSEISTIVCREKDSVKKRIRRIVLNKMNAQGGQMLSEILDLY